MDALDRRLLSALSECGKDRRVAGGVRALSWAGEHGALWLVGGLAGAVADEGRRGVWLRGTAMTAGAHLASMGLKRVVRRPRPAAGCGVRPLVRTAGRYSFPSSHAASATAAGIASGTLGPVGWWLAAPLAAAMCVSRVVAGVHYPTDVIAGVALGALIAGLGARWTTETKGGNR